MLKVIFRDEDDCKAYTNADVEFAIEQLVDTPAIRNIIHDIEDGEYYSSNIFIDRFGVGLYTSFLSTGCKTALLVELRGMRGDNRIIDTLECGYNAQDAIIMNCRHGVILMQRPLTPISCSRERGDEIDVECNGFRFTDVDRFNRFVLRENEDNPDLTIPGIEKLEDGVAFKGDYRDLFKKQKLKSE